MRPTFSRFYSAYACLLYAVLLGYFGLSYAFGQQTVNSQNISFSQLGGVHSFTANRFFRFSVSSVPFSAWNQSGQSSVFTVFKSRNILKVFQTIISFVAVNMINLFVLRAFTQKGFGNKTVDKSGYLSFFVKKTNSQVASLWNNSRFKEVFSGMAKNPSKIGNRVTAFVAGNGSPFFNFFNRSANLRISHNLNLLYRFRLWLGSLSVGSTLANRFYFITQEAV